MLAMLKGVLGSIALLVVLWVANPETVAHKMSPSVELSFDTTLQSDSVSHFSYQDSLPNLRLRLQRDSLSRALLEAVHETYPAVALRWVIIERPDTFVIGRFYAGHDKHPAVSLLIGRFQDSVALDQTIETLSHEVGHYLDPMFQFRLATRDSRVKKSYGPNHLEILREFADRFLKISRDSNSLTFSGNYYLKVMHDSLVQDSLPELRYFREYMAEAFSCYFTGCFLSRGNLTTQEQKEIQIYIEYLNKASYSVSDNLVKRREIIGQHVPAIRAIIAVHQPPPKR